MGCPFREAPQARSWQEMRKRHHLLAALEALEAPEEVREALEARSAEKARQAPAFGELVAQMQAEPRGAWASVLEALADVKRAALERAALELRQKR